MAGQSVRDIKRRITSVKNMRQITKAMEMVAAAKLRRAQSAGDREPSLHRQVAGSAGPAGQRGPQS